MEFSHKLPNVKVVSDRHPFIVNRCRGKTVLHIGCVDSGLLEERYKQGQLLHQKIEEVALRQWG